MPPISNFMYKYHTDEQFRNKIREKNKMRYRSSDANREKQYFRYNNDPEYREKKIINMRQYYHNNKKNKISGKVKFSLNPIDNVSTPTENYLDILSLFSGDKKK